MPRRGRLINLDTESGKRIYGAMKEGVWQGAGWTAPDPGSRHYPEVKGGALIALFYLPAGRISDDFKAPS